MRKALLAACIFAFYSLSEAGKNKTLFITYPENGGMVSLRDTVIGTVKGDKDVYVVIRPEGTPDYWVQPNVSVGDDGKWRVLVYFGEDATPPGTKFEVRAFANPKGKLKEGDKLSNWPKAEARSDLIVVQRN